MIARQTAEAAAAGRVVSPNGKPAIEDFFGSHRDGGGHGPQAFLVEVLEPGYVIRPHFDQVPQFQVVVAGGGLLGKHPIGSGTVHFADAQTHYGPIVAGPAGLAFFTLRNLADTGAHYMPESRGERSARAGRNLSCEAGLGAPAAGVDEAIRLERPDGLQVRQVRAAAREPLPPAEPGAGGTCCVVLSGSIRAGATYPEQSCLLVAPGGAAPHAEAGESGAALVYLRFPTPRR